MSLLAVADPAGRLALLHGADGRALLQAQLATAPRWFLASPLSDDHLLASGPQCLRDFSDCTPAFYAILASAHL